MSLAFPSSFRSLAQVLGGRRNVSDVGWMMYAQLYTQMATVVSGIVVARYVVPGEYGVWVAVNLFLPYLQWLQLGIPNGLGRQLPLLLGQEAFDFADKIIGTTLWCALVTGVLGTCIAAVLIWKLGTANPLVYLMLIQIFTQGFASTLLVIARSFGRFRNAAIVLNISSTAMLLGVVLVYWFHLDGLFYRLCITQLAIVIGYTYAVRDKLNLRWDTKCVWLLVKDGFPIFLAGYVMSLGAVAGRSVVALRLPLVELGNYGFAAFVQSGFTSLNSGILDTLYPQMAHDFGRYGQPRRLLRYVWRHQIWIVLVALLPGAAVYILLPWFIKLAAPHYLAAIPVARILLVGTATMMFSISWGNLLNAIGKAWAYVVFLAVNMALIWGLAMLLTQAGWGIRGVAWANLIANMFTCVLIILGTLFIVFRNSTKSDQPFPQTGSSN